MSVVQFGENTVCIILEDKRYVIRELEVSEFMPNKTKFDSARIVNAWKNHCLTEKNLFVRSSIYDNTAFTDSVSVEGGLIEIHFHLNQTSTGIFKDKRAVAITVLQKS